MKLEKKTKKQLITELEQIQQRAQRQNNAILDIVTFEDRFTGKMVKEVQHLTQASSKALQVERVSIWLLSADNKNMNCLDLYESKNNQHTGGAVLITSDYPVYFNSIKNENRIDAPNALTDSRTSEFVKDYLIPLGITSMLVAGINVKGKTIGVLCLEHVGEKRKWHFDEILFATSIASMAGQTFSNIDRLQAEKALKESEMLYKQAIDNADAVAYKRNFLTESFSYIGKRIFEFTGYHPHELTEDIWVDMVQECVMRGKCTGLTEDEATKLTRQGNLKEWYSDFRIISKDGKEHWLADSSLRIDDKNGKPIASLGILQEITERKQTEEKIFEAMQFNEQIIAQSPIGIAIYKESGQCFITNDAMAKIIGASKEQVIQQSFENIYSWKQSGLINLAKKALLEGNSQRKEIEVISTFGKKVILDCQLVPLCAGKNKNLLFMATDMTSYRKMQKIMLQSEKMLSIGGLAAGMAHEINNPLAGMVSTAEVINNRLTNSQIPENIQAAKKTGTTMKVISMFMEERGILKMLDRINSSGIRIAKIISNMLSFAQNKSQQQVKQDLCVLLDHSLEITGSDFNYKKKYDFRHIQIFRKYENNLPLVPCNSDQIQQVFINILKNGAEAMHKNKLTGQKQGSKKSKFTLQLKHIPKENMIEIVFEDNGPGMDSKIQERIFEPFYTTKPVGKGVGLGLSLSYFIITNNHNGKLFVNSTPQKGTRFIIHLPVTNDKTNSIIIGNND